MATVSNAYNDNVLYDWVSDASDVHEDELFYEEANNPISGAALDTSSEGEEDLIEFDGTAPDTEYFLDSSALEHLSYEEEEGEAEGELEQYFSSLATISCFDFSSIHVPLSTGPLSTEQESVSEFVHFSDVVPKTSLLSSDSDTETMQVMSDSIHHAQDGNTLLGVPLDTPQFVGFTGICGSEMDCLPNRMPSLDIFGSKMQGDVSSMFSSSSNEKSDTPSEEELSSCDGSKRTGVCLKTLHSSKTKLATQNEVVGNSPSKLQAAAKKARASKTLHAKCLKSQINVKNITSTAGSATKQRKRKRNAIGSPNVFPQDDTVFSSDDSDEDQAFQSRPKRRRFSKQRHHTELTLPNLVRKKYLIALNDPRFMPQLYDPQLRANFFAHEQVLRVIETENDHDIEII